MCEGMGWPRGVSWNQFSVRDAIAQAGGLSAYRSRVVSLTTHESVYVRSFGAFWLGVVGGPENTRELVRLLHGTNLPVECEEDRGVDLAGAVLGLGILGAREYAEEIAGLLRSGIPEVRLAAARSIGRMKAEQYADKVTVLLGDKDRRTVDAALWCLAELGAKEHVDAILKVIRDPSCTSETMHAALRALVVLEAREEARGIVKQLFERYPHLAASVSALLGLKEQTDRVAILLDSKEWIVRAAGISALAILGEDRYVDRIAAVLNDERELLRICAAWALVLLESRRHATAAMAVIDTNSDKELVLGIDMEMASAAKVKELECRAQASLARLKGALGTTKVSR